MNVHPIIVHFPIALWILYCLILIVQLFRGRSNEKLNTIKYFCLFVGTIGGVAALQSGEGAQALYGKGRLVETHEQRAQMSQNLFAIVSIVTLYTLQTWTMRLTRDLKLRSILTRIVNHRAMAIIGVIGMIMLTAVGALGGAISRGTGSGDPVSDYAVQLLVPANDTTATTP